MNTAPTPPQRRIPVAVLGATGAVGQRFVQLLDGHPWFALAEVVGSARTAGRPYGAVAGWRLPGDVPAEARDLPVRAPGADLASPVVFSALPAEVAGETEEALARAGHAVFSNARNHRLDPDVPLIVPEINADHAAVLERQRQERGWSGALVTNANCSTIHLVLALKPLQDAFGLDSVLVTTLQAASGAGYPGVPSLDLLDNVVPYIGGEEEKMAVETRKILGGYDAARGFLDAPVRVSATCTRVPVRDGHTESVSVGLARPAELDDVAAALRDFASPPQALALPSAPARPLIVLNEPDRPQPILDRDRERGMATVVGRLRPCPILGYKFVLLGHNTIRGAAGASILNAELLLARGLLPKYEG
ncbi:MAG TPA: aspartate-semialdehyde dehydrogenase [Thermomicrobiales bacterium]|nr:aspartate-semialdehyde dehydrogenase [Thermomicrobiales bacterium]